MLKAIMRLLQAGNAVKMPASMVSQPTPWPPNIEANGNEANGNNKFLVRGDGAKMREDYRIEPRLHARFVR